MARLFELSVILLCCLFEAICVETDDNKYRNAAQFVLDTFNRRPDSSYVYGSEKELSTSRVKRQYISQLGSLPGPFTQAQSSDPYIQEIANAALFEIDWRSNSYSRQKILRIVSAQMQVAFATVVRLNLELGYTTCCKGELDDINNCQRNFNLGTQTCHVEVWDRSWLQLREVTNVMCSSTLGMYGATAGVGVAAGVGIAAGVGVAAGMGAAEGMSAAAGMGAAAGMYVQDDSEDTYDTEGSAVQRKRSSMPGGGTTYAADICDPFIREIITYALVQIDWRSNSLYRQKVIRVSEARRQDFGGTMVQLTLELGYTNCRKGEANDIRNCQLNSYLGTRNCRVKVSDIPWLQVREVTNVMCTSPKRMCGGAAGMCFVAAADVVTADVVTAAAVVTANTTNSKTPTIQHYLFASSSDGALTTAPIAANVSDPYIQEIASSALLEIDWRSNDSYRQKVIRIVEARKQEVEGTKVFLTLELGYTTCRKEEGGDISNCQLKEDSGTQTCYVDVWDRPSLQLYEVTSVTCNSTVQARSKRHTSNYEFRPFWPITNSWGVNWG